MNKIINVNNEKLPIVVDIKKYKKLIDECKVDSFNGVIHLLFDKTVEFIHPFFSILLINEYERSINKNQLVIDITNISIDNVQHAFIHHLQQYIDYGIVSLEYQRDQIDRSKVIKTNIRKYIPKKIYKNRKIVIVYATKNWHKEISLNPESNYSHIPIMKISNVNKELFYNNKEDFREKLYDGLQIDKEKSFWENMVGESPNDSWNLIFDNYLNLYQYDIETVKSFKDIFFEMAKNIKDHTLHDKMYANGYLSFFLNKKNKVEEKTIIEVIVADDFIEGFLNSYLKTMRKEKKEEEKRIDNKGIQDDEDKVVLEEYEQIINELELNDNQTALENIFNLKYILAVQKKRLIKHFGIPLLLKHVKEINELNPNMIELDVYLNRGNNSYHIKYNGIGKVEVNPIDNISIRGTYIHLKFPYKLETNTIKEANEVLNLHTSFFKDKLSHKAEIKKVTSSFVYVSYENIIDKTNFKYNEKKTFIIKYNEEEKSDFIRAIHAYAYLYEKNLKDIIVTNFPIIDNIKYLKLFRDTTSLKKIANILVLNYIKPQAFFIGGKSEEQMSLVNTYLSKEYNFDKTNFTKMICEHSESDKLDLETNLFYNVDSEGNVKNYLIPFDLVIKDSTYKNEHPLYFTMVNNHLEKYKKNYHVDIGDGNHIKEFYFFKNIFEDSTWISRIAYSLSEKLTKNMVIIGIGNYSSLIVKKAISIRGYKNESMIIYDFTDFKEYWEFIKWNCFSKIIVFCPVITEGKKINELLKLIPNAMKISAIKLYYNECENYKDFKFFFMKDINSIVMSSSKCKSCFGEGKEGDSPLLKLSQDGFTLENLYHDKIVKERHFFKEYNKEITWKNSIHFGHIKRGSNHYLYYTKTLIFFKNNEKDISQAFKGLVKLEDSEIPVILVPLHQTNNEFTALIDEVVFNNDAVIHYFNLTNKNQNYKIIDRIKRRYENNSQYKFYFVDDELSSGNTLEYFSKLLKNITNYKIKKFDGVFTLINRTSDYDSDALINFCNRKNFYVYKNLNIKPIKTNFENCYLCERRIEFENYVKNSSLVFMKNQFKKQAINLQAINSNKIENFIDMNNIVEFKSFLKMYATEYVYNNLSEEFDLEKCMHGFFSDIKKYIKGIYLKDRKTDKNFDFVLNKFLKLEGEIALVKALYFPKASYHYLIREQIHYFVLTKIKNLREKYFDNHTKSISINKIFSYRDYLRLKKNKLEIVLAEFISFYKESLKTTIDVFNFYIITASYLNINYILSKEMIEFYFCLAKTVKKNENLKLKLLHKYPVAVKMLVSYSEAKSLYFFKQFKDFGLMEGKNGKRIYSFNYTKDFSLINALYVENNNFIDKNLQLNSTKKDNHFNYLKFSITEYINDKKYNIENIAFFINIHLLEGEIELIDIFNKFKNLNEKVQVDELNMFKGVASKKNSASNIIEIDDIPVQNRIYSSEEEKDEDFNNIWCNYYDKLKQKSIIRITKVEKQTLRFVPVGVIVIYHQKELKPNDSLLFHLNTSRNLLKVQNEISDYIQKNNIIDKSIHEKKRKLLENTTKLLAEKAKFSEELLERTTSIIENINHTYRKYTKYSDFLVEINSKEDLNNLILYSIGIELVAELGSINEHLIERYKSSPKDDMSKLNCFFFSKELSNEGKLLTIMKNFAIVSSNYLGIEKDAKYNIQTNIKEDFTIEYFDETGVKADTFHSIIFELFFNIIKKNEKGSNILITIDDDSIYIENEGLKVDVEEREKIFKRGYTSNQSVGLGLGLPSIRSFLQLFNCTIECIESINKNYDCCFRIKRED